MNRASSRVAIVMVLAAAPALAQNLIPSGPVKVTRPQGEFASKLNGALAPTGKGWKTAVEPERRFQIQVPEGWKIEAKKEGSVVIAAFPPGQDKTRKSVLLVLAATPADGDPLQIEPELAFDYAEGLAQDPMLARLQFKVTDSGFVEAAGLRFALAGGTMNDGKSGLIRQEQLLYIAEDRVVTLQFLAPEAEFKQHADAVARIFASYSNLIPPRVKDNAPDEKTEKP